jgi:hypothetical protein
MTTAIVLALKVSIAQGAIINDPIFSQVLNEQRNIVYHF